MFLARINNPWKINTPLAAPGQKNFQEKENGALPNLDCRANNSSGQLVLHSVS